MSAGAFDLRGEGRVAFISGSASGLGRATAEVFAEAGYRLLLVDVDRARGQVAAAGLTPAEARFLEADVADPAQAEAAVAAAVATWGRLDFVLNNAGILGAPGLIEDLDEENLERVLAVDLKSVVHVSKHAVRAQRAQGGGSILNVASITALTGSSCYPAYSAAKAGVIALTRSVARHVGRYNIRVNCLNPGSIASTDLERRSSRGNEASAEEKRRAATGLMARIPLGRPAQPRDVAHVALFLASPLASHIHGAAVTVDGGEMLGFQ